jgi:hypothetical protein
MDDHVDAGEAGLHRLIVAHVAGHEFDPARRTGEIGGRPLH